MEYAIENSFRSWGCTTDQSNLVLFLNYRLMALQSLLAYLKSLGLKLKFRNSFKPLKPRQKVRHYMKAILVAINPYSGDLHCMEEEIALFSFCIL